MNKNFILIPTYCPPDTFPDLVISLINLGLNDIIVVDDGSPPTFQKVFDRLPADVVRITLPTNIGKGGALKAGYERILRDHQDVFIVTTCDDDGQHHPRDVHKVHVLAVSSGRVAAFLGTRTFSAKVPMKSLLGNSAMKLLVLWATGKEVADTQTGLRSLHVDCIRAILNLHSKRFGFETAALLELIRLKHEVVEVPIDTIYIQGNTRTRFRPFVDSVLILRDSLAHFLKR